MKNYDLTKLRTIPRWIILLIDTILMAMAFSVAYFFVWTFSLPHFFQAEFAGLLMIYIPICMVVLYMLRTHTGLVRYTNTADIARILTTTSIVNLIFGIVFLIDRSLIINLSFERTCGLLIFNWCLSTLVLILLRLTTKRVYYMATANHPSKNRIKAVVYGTDQRAMMIRQAIESQYLPRIRVVAYVDRLRSKLKSTIEQRKVYHIKDLIKLKDKYGVTQLFLVKEQLGQRDKQVLIERCLRLNIKVMTVPPIHEWIAGQITLKQVQRLRIEDILQREPIVIDNKRVSQDLRGKRVLVTGAAGSIGSEIVRQVLTFQPQQVILCDQAETALHEVHLELRAKYDETTFVPFVADICNDRRMEALFVKYQPQVVFHAAAYKHVPMMEGHPAEAVMTNVGGTKLVADLAVAHQVEKFVMVSTDKAVNPTNVMGASKRIAEIYVQTIGALGAHSTRFITTRFGNVLGSNGSVIPLFRKQIEAGGPITVTHPEITRYFMTIPEAVQLVLEAGTMGHGGEIFVFDMGKPVRITDLATKMALLAGLKPGDDIDIIYTGLRQGEKLYEELLSNAEEVLPTHHEKISIARVRTYLCDEIIPQINVLLDAASEQNTSKVVRQMKAIVPEFRSQNSPYEQYDEADTKQLIDHFSK